VRARVGLVLAGGGAKGAYQVGVVERLAEAGVRLAAVAGASIGALNASVVAAAPDLATAARRLAAVWDEVGRAAGTVSPGLGDLLTANPVTRPEFLDQLLRRHVDLTELGDGLPLWVSVYPSPPPSAGHPDLGWFIDAVLFDASARATWLHVNSLPPEERHEALCASAALPLILPPRTVGGVRYRDGGLADNTPIRALLAHAPCDLFIIVHLARGELWDARDYAPGRILEIRPGESLNTDGALGGVGAALDFTSGRAARLRRLGYHDAEQALEAVREVVGSASALRGSQDVMLNSLRLLHDEATGIDPSA
jgi:NTE family protein